MTPSVMVELLPNNQNTKKDYNWWFVPLPIADIQVPSSILIIQLFNCYTSETKKVRLSIINAIKCPSLTLFFQTTKNPVQSLLKIVWEMNLEIVRDEFTYKNKFRHQKIMSGTPFLMLKKKKNWTIFRDKFEQKTHKLNHSFSRISENY